MCAKTAINGLCTSIDYEAGSSQYVRLCDVGPQQVTRNVYNLSLKVSGLKAGTVYFFKVQAQNFVGKGSSVERNMRAMQRPSEPLNVTVASAGQFLLLSWLVPVNTGYGDGSLPLLGFRIERFDGNDNQDFLAQFKLQFKSFLIGANSLTYQVEPPPGNTPRSYFRIYAVNDVGESPASRSASLRSLTLPGLVGNLRLSCSTNPDVLPNVLSRSNVHLDWNAPTDLGGQGAIITGYEVHTSLDSSFTHCNSDLAECDSAIVTTSMCSQQNGGVCYGRNDLVRGRKYYLRVRAWNFRGPSPWSEILGCSYAVSPMVVSVNVLGANGMVDKEPHGPRTGGTEMEIFVRDLYGSDGKFLDLNDKLCTVQFGPDLQSRASGNCKLTGAVSQEDGSPLTSVTVTSPQVPVGTTKVIAKFGYMTDSTPANLQFFETAVFPFRFEAVAAPRILSLYPTFGPDLTRVDVGVSRLPTIARTDVIRITTSCESSPVVKSARDVVPVLSVGNAQNVSGDVSFGFNVPSVSFTLLPEGQSTQSCDIAICLRPQGPGCDTSFKFSFLYFRPNAPVITSMVPDYGNVRTKTPVEIALQNYVWVSPLFDQCSAPVLKTWNMGPLQSVWRRFSGLKFEDRAADCCGSQGISSILLRCLTPTLPIGVENVTIRLNDLVAIGLFRVSGNVLLSALKPVSSSADVFSVNLPYGPMPEIGGPSDEVTGPAVVLSKKISLVVFEVSGLNERIEAPADVKLALILPPDSKEVDLDTKIVLSTSMEFLRMSAELDLMDGQTGLFDVKFYLRGESVARRNRAVRGVLSLPEQVDIAPYTGDAFIRFANVTSGPASGGTSVEVEIGGNFPQVTYPGRGLPRDAYSLTVSINGTLQLENIYWSSAPGKTVVYFSTLPWVSGIAQIEIKAEMRK